MTLQFEGVGFGTGTGSSGKIGTVVLVAMGSQPSTPYTVGSKWFYNGKIYTATSTSAHDSGVVPSYDTAYLYNGTYYYWDGSALQGADESNLVHITGTETISGDKTFSGSVALGDNASAQTKATSDTSDAVATTKFVKDFAQDGEWQKPADWIDIRSGALDNSVYFLVAHSKPTGTPGSYVIETYAKFSLMAVVSTSENTYDVFIDETKVATTASNQQTDIDFAQLYNDGILQSGYDIASPGSGNYTSHIIRVTPSVDTDNISIIRTAKPSGTPAGYYMGCLWTHFEIDNEIRIQALLSDDNYHNPICQAITAKNDTLTFVIGSSGNTGLREAFHSTISSVINYVKKLPILVANNSDYDYTHRRDFTNVYATKVIIKNNSKKLSFGILKGFRGQYFETENPLRLFTGYGTNGILIANDVTNLKRLPAISKEKATVAVLARFDSLEPTIINESFNDERTMLRIYGASGHITNLVGLIVSNEAPFNYETAPQINVSYTAMDRAALVRLFNSMPTVSAGQVIDVTGATGANDLTADDLAIATGKGWSVTR